MKAGGAELVSNGLLQVLRQQMDSNYLKQPRLLLFVLYWFKQRTSRKPIVIWNAPRYGAYIAAQEFCYAYEHFFSLNSAPGISLSFPLLANIRLNCAFHIQADTPNLHMQPWDFQADTAGRGDHVGVLETKAGLMILTNCQGH